MIYLGTILPSSKVAAIAKKSSQLLSGLLETKAEFQDVTLSNPEGIDKTISVPVDALSLLVSIMSEMGQGNSVKLVPIHTELTTQEAANLLNVSRPSIIKILDKGDIPHTVTGNRRKVRFVDLQKYQYGLQAKRLESLDELSALDQKLDLY